MRISSAALVALLVAVAPAQAEDVTDPVPGHPGVTYETLLRQALPHLSKTDDGTWDSGPIAHFRGLDGKPATTEDKPPQDLEIGFKTVEIHTVRENGHKRLLVFTDGNSGGTGFDAVLAVFDPEPKTPKLLDYIDAGRDQWNGIGRVTALSPGTDAFVAFSSHSNSNQSYELTSVLFLRGGKFHQVASFFVYGESACSYRRTQELTLATAAAPASQYRALALSIRIETEPGDPGCGEGQIPPRKSTKTVRDVYRWDAAKGRFVPTTKALERLSDKNWKLATQ